MANIGCFYRDYNDSGGFPTEYKYLIEEVYALGHQVSVYCYGEEEKTIEYQEGFFVKQYQSPKYFFNVSNEITKDLYLNNKNFDLFIVVGAHIRENYPISRLLSKNQIKYLFSPGGGAYNPYLLNKNSFFKQIWRIFFELKILNSAHLIRSYSQTNTKFIRNYGGKNPCVELMEGIDYKNIPKVIDKYTFNNNKINLVYLGRIDIEGKGIEHILAGFKQAIEANLNIKLNIFGPFESDVDKIYFNKMLTEFSTHDIEYFGPVYGDKKYAILEAADLFIYPSHYEGSMPRSIREALYFSTPVIATKDTHVVEKLEKYSAGFQCKHDAESIYRALEKYVLFEDKKQLSINAKLLSDDFYNWESVGSEFSIILDRFLLKTGKNTNDL